VSTTDTTGSVGGDITFTDRLSVLANGNVGIGETIPTEKLHVGGNIKMQATTAIVTYQNAANTWNVGLDAADPSFKFKDGTAERLRITADGYVLIGKTNTTFSNAGIELRSGNLGARFIRNYAEPIFVNRTGNDGNIIKIYCQTTDVGNIGSQGNRPYFGNSINFSIKPDDANSGSLVPANQNGVPNDNVADIGLSSNRWNDLYLGGGIYLGGTGSTNYLDDYEEGTWTPTITGSSGASGQSYNIQNGRFTKIGSFVHYTFDVQLSAVGTLSGTYIVIGGLPFTGVGGNLGGTATIGYHNVGGNAQPLGAYVSGSNVYLMEQGASGSDYVLVSENRIGSSSRILGSIMVHTAS
jgi:hypothetical protein